MATFEYEPWVTGEVITAEKLNSRGKPRLILTAEERDALDNHTGTITIQSGLGLEDLSGIQYCELLDDEIVSIDQQPSISFAYSYNENNEIEYDKTKIALSNIGCLYEISTGLIYSRDSGRS